MGPILVDLSSACFGTLSRGAEIMDHLQYLLLGKCGSSPGVCCKPASVAQQSLSESSCYVIITLDCREYLLVCGRCYSQNQTNSLVPDLVIRGCKGGPGGTAQIAAGEGDSLCLCSQCCHCSPSPFAAGNCSRRCSSGQCSSAFFTTLVYHSISYFQKEKISCYIDSNCPCKPRMQLLAFGEGVVGGNRPGKK